MLSKITLLRLGSAKTLTRSVVVGSIHEPLNQMLYLPFT